MIVERTENKVIARRQNPVIRRKNFPPGQVKKLCGAKSARAFAPRHRKKAVTGIRNKSEKNKNEQIE